MSNREICELSAVDLARAIRRRRLSPAEVTNTVLERIERVNPGLNAFCTSMADEARQAAAIAEAGVMKGEELGSLHGVPVSVKDLMHVEGVRTTFGSRLFEDLVSTKDAPVVERLRRAGAIIIGRTNSPEFGWKAVTDNPLFGITRNPWNPGLTPGGSSGGAAAAVAAGLGPVGIGNDGGGSIRIPASFCGLVGHKCSFGRVPNDPASSDDTLVHTGPLTRTVADTALIFDVIAGPDNRDIHTLPAQEVEYVGEIDRGIKGLRMAYSPDLGYAQVDSRVAEVCQVAAARFVEAGALVETLDVGLSDPYRFWAKIFYGNIAATLGDQLAERGDLLDPGLRAAVERGLKLSATDYVKALVQRQRFAHRVGDLFEQFDLVVTPTVAVPPFPVGMDNPEPLPGSDRWRTSWTPFTYPFNLTGQPAVSVPAGWIADDDEPPNSTPIGLQIVGRRFDDVTVLRAARAWEQIAPWSDRRPQV